VRLGVGIGEVEGVGYGIWFGCWWRRWIGLNVLMGPLKTAADFQLIDLQQADCIHCHNCTADHTVSPCAKPAVTPCCFDCMLLQVACGGQGLPVCSTSAG
jgi:hypothetical protein